MLRLQGKVALITGGASGLGKATASEFIRHGARVVIADIDTRLGPTVARDLGSNGDEAQVAQAVDTTLARHGKLDVLYNNAGIVGPTLPSSIAHLDLDYFDRVMRVKHRVMIPVGSGSILCTASISGIMAGMGPHPYTVSKFAIPGIVKSAASKLCQHGVRINFISPGAIPTPTVMRQFGGLLPGATEEELVTMVNEVGELKGAKCEDIDVAMAALYLASDEAKYVTGHNLVDGGFTVFKSLRIPSQID